MIDSGLLASKDFDLLFFPFNILIEMFTVCETLISFSPNILRSKG